MPENKPTTMEMKGQQGFILNQRKHVLSAKKGRVIFNYCSRGKHHLPQLGSQTHRPKICMPCVWDSHIRRARNFFEIYYLGELTVADLEHKMEMRINSTKGN